MLQGWHVNGIFTAQGGTPLFIYDSFNDISGTGEFNDHWNITGDPANLHWSKNTPIPFLDADQFTTVEYDPVNELFHATGGANPTAQRCYDQAFRMGGQAGADQLINGPDGSIFGGCFVSGGTILTPPAPGTFGNMRRNVVYGPGFVNLDFSVIKDFKLGRAIQPAVKGRGLQSSEPSELCRSRSRFVGWVGGNFRGGAVHAGHRRFKSGDRFGRLRHIQVGAKIIW